MALPTKYCYLANEDGPKMLLEALKLFGVSETLGSKNNPTIIAWAKEVGGNVADVYKADSIPWCGLFMAVVAKRALKTPPKDPLWALNWGTFGKHIEEPMLGDTLVFTRRTSTGATAGHVGIYVGESKTTYHVLGGNTSDKVTIAEIAKSRLYTARRPEYINQPKNVRKIFISASGKVSENEQ